MTTAIACNLALDACGILILLLYLVPVWVRKSEGNTNQRKQALLLYAVMAHLFALFTHLAALVSILTDAGQVAGVFSTLSILLLAVSVLLLLLCVFCDEGGVFRLPKGQQIPVGQIICMALPATLSVCLTILWPDIHPLGIAWAVSLHLISSLNLIDSEKELAKTEKRLGLAQAAQMAVQMQPHFIFNTLSAIQSLCQTAPQTAAENVENLAGFLRGNIDALSSDALIPFDTEMRHIRQYIALEQADPSRQFHFDYELNVRSFSLPALTVQPIVENAVKHGALTHRDGSGRVCLTTEKIGTFIRITVTDNGTQNAGLTDAQRKNRGVGIENTRKRLMTLCGGSLQINARPGGTQATILIPSQEDE